MRLLLLPPLLLASSVAAAEPLNLAWRAPGPACELPMRRAATELVVVEPTRTKLLRLELATGKELPSLPLPVKATTTHVTEVVGDTVVLKAGAAYVGIDGATGAERWRHPAADGGYRRALRVDTDLVVSSRPQQDELLERLDGKTGQPRWSAPLPKTPGEITWLGGDGARLFVGVQHASKKRYVLHALDAKDGHLLWSGTSPIKTYQAPAIAGEVIVIPDNGDGMRFLDAGSGKELGSLPFPSMRNAVASGGRVVFIQSTLPPGSGEELVALDAASRKTLWRLALSGDSSLEGATPAAVIVVDGNGVLRMLDPASGKVVASYGIVAQQNVDVDGRAPLVILCDGPEVLALDPGAPAAPEATTAVSASIKCKGCSAHRFAFRIGDTTGTTDAKGNLGATVTGRGRYRLELRLGDHGWTRTRAVVALDGKKEQALGTVAVEAGVDGD